MLINCKRIILLLFSLNSISCEEFSFLNSSHLDFLYEDIVVNGKEMGIIHIYSNYPDYGWIDDADEGIACVDDAARAAVFYLKYSKFNAERKNLRKAKNLLKFLIYMQAENGYYYNFIWKDYSINKDFRTSVAEANWWSWRALWALMEGYNFFKKTDPEFAGDLFKSVNKIIEAIKKDIPAEYETETIDGFVRPSWLPYKTASDQAAVLLLGLTLYCNHTEDEIILRYCNKLAEGIILMQEGNPSAFPYGAFMSWENLWHGWGNLQSYALLNFYEVTKNDSLKNAALKEINNFHDYLISRNYLMEFAIEKAGSEIILTDEKKFAQIAYNIRPMVYSSLKAYETTGDTLYLNKAVKSASWFLGENPADQQMYFPENGKCFDGITDETTINKNSGAESTIEALLSLLEIERHQLAKEKLYNFLYKRENR
jgi:hypothetical protein